MATLKEVALLCKHIDFLTFTYMLMNRFEIYLGFVPIGQDLLTLTTDISEFVEKKRAGVWLQLAIITDDFTDFFDRFAEFLAEECFI